MLTRVLLPRGATVSVRRLFATSVPRWKVPTSGEGTATAPLDANAIKAQIAQLKVAQQSIEKAELKAREQRIAATVVALKAERVEMMKACRDRKEQAATRATTE